MSYEQKFGIKSATQKKTFPAKTREWVDFDSTIRNGLDLFIYLFTLFKSSGKGRKCYFFESLSEVNYFCRFKPAPIFRG